MTDAEQIEVQAIYAGQRLVSGGKLAHCWVVKDREMLFSKPTGGVVGGIYILKMTPDLEQVYQASPRYTMERISDQDKIASWEVHHLTTVRARKRAAAERKHKGDSVIPQATAHLEELSAGFRNVQEVYALAEITKERMLDAYWKRHG